MSSSDTSDLSAVLIIRGCGLLSRHIVQFLLEHSTAAQNITAFDLKTTRNRFPNVTYVAGNLGSKEAVASAFDKAQPNIIINVASPDPMTPNSKVFWRCNVTGVQNMVECAQERGNRVLVHSSSSEVVQNGYDDIDYATEDWPVLDSPVNGSMYAKTKAVGEGIMLRANRQHGLLTTAIRGTTLFGEGDLVLTRHFIELGRTGRIKFQVGEGRNMSKRVDGEAFNISNGNPYPFWKVARFLSAAAGYPVQEKDVWKIPLGLVQFFMAVWEWIYWVATLGGTPPVTRRMLKYTTRMRVFDITKARERFGFNPRVSMEDGLR